MKKAYLPTPFVEVMFWRADDTAICFGTQSKFRFDTREDAEKFVEAINIDECKWVSFQNEYGEIDYHEVYEEYDLDEYRESYQDYISSYIY